MEHEISFLIVLGIEYEKVGAKLKNGGFEMQPLQVMIVTMYTGNST